MLIRPARPDEADDLTRLCMRSKRSNGYDDAFMRACAAELAVTPERMGQAAFIVAAEGDLLLGCAALHRLEDPKTGEVEAFFIAPEAQRRGVGRALWDALHTMADGLGLVRLKLDADPAAVPFYEAMGFVRTGSVPSGSIAGRTLPLMERALS